MDNFFMNYLSFIFLLLTCSLQDPYFKGYKDEDILFLNFYLM